MTEQGPDTLLGTHLKGKVARRPAFDGTVPIFNHLSRSVLKKSRFLERMHDKLGNGGRTGREYTRFLAAVGLFSQDMSFMLFLLTL